MTKKNEKKTQDLRAGDRVEYDGSEWEVVETFASGKYAVIFSELGRYSADVRYLKKLED